MKNFKNCALIQEGIDFGVSKKSFSEILKGVEERLRAEGIKGENT